MTTGVACPGCGIHLVGDPGQQCTTCQLQAGPGLGRALWLRFLRAIDGGEITLAEQRRQALREYAARAR